MNTESVNSAANNLNNLRLVFEPTVIFSPATDLGFGTTGQHGAV
jgi:hypothetical protein